MDVNDFVHINCAYLTRASRSESQSTIMYVAVAIPTSIAPLSQPPAGVLMLHHAPTMLENPSTTLYAWPPLMRLSPNRADLDYTEYLNERSPVQDSGFAEPIWI